MVDKKIARKDSWYKLKQFTSARIALGRAGGSLKTGDWLDFKLAHARARDAVHYEFDVEALSDQLSSLSESVLLLSSRVQDRAEFLKRPDLGRCLNDVSKQQLREDSEKQTDLVIVVSDGLSAIAVHEHVSNLLSMLIPKLLGIGWSISPVVIVRFGRVAIED